VLKPKLDRIEERYAFRILENKAFQGFAQSHGNGILAHRAAINWDILKGIGVPLPPVGEQQAILGFLDHETAKIDALVAEQERLIELLKEKRQAVISHAVTKGLDPLVPMKDSGVEWLGEVPAHWAVVRLKRLMAESVAGPYGASLTKAMYSSSGYRVYGQQQVIADDFSIGDYFISEEKYAEMRRYTVYEGDVLISVMGTIGKVGVVTADAEPGIINPRLVRYRCNEKVLPRYLQRVLMSQKHREYLSLESNGTTM
jgi:type I restriction enzyme S subunit